MTSSSKPIVFTRHAQRRMKGRSVTRAEVISTIRSPDTLRRGKRGAMRAFKTFAFGTQHQGAFYQFKKVEARYIDASTDIIVLTVISKFHN